MINHLPPELPNNSDDVNRLIGTEIPALERTLKEYDVFENRLLGVAEKNFGKTDADSLSIQLSTIAEDAHGAFFTYLKEVHTLVESTPGRIERVTNLLVDYANRRAQGIIDITRADENHFCLYDRSDMEAKLRDLYESDTFVTDTGEVLAYSSRQDADQFRLGVLDASFVLKLNTDLDQLASLASNDIH